MSFLAIILFSTMSYANDVFIRYNIHAKTPYPDVSSVTLGYIHPVSIIKAKYEGGILLDRRVPNKTGYLQAGVGVQPEYGPVYIYFYQSVGLLSHTDNYLSTHFQFFEDVGIGFRGKDRTFIGIGYKHISNGGIKLPNKGKDLIGLHLGFEL